MIINQKSRDMTDSHPENENDNESSQPMHAEFRHQAVTARVSEDATFGVFANAAIILSGHYEFVIDFILRMGKPDRVMARLILPVPVVGQFVNTLRESLQNYETQFGAVPEIPLPKNRPGTPGVSPEQSAPGGFVGSIGPEGAVHSNSLAGGAINRKAPPIEEIYDDLKLDDHLNGGTYANAVLIRHSPTEFCFDFVANIFPRSTVNARVFMAIPQVKPLLNSLSHSFDQFRKRQTPPPTEEE
ncbi:MAG TPA: hypothetical protein DIW81_03110 [Planctomycetaceae bacterium]|nr:hypothetical protein [Rubinisphaera sp.]HCS50573.1 hypothetical protein [Planctomycetaceae bacterium]